VQDSFEKLASDATPNSTSRCFVQLLTYASCFVCSWWHYWFDIAWHHFHAINHIMSVDELMKTLRADSRFLSQACIVSLFRVNYDPSLGVDEMADYLVYLERANEENKLEGGVNYNRTMYSNSKWDDCGPVSEWLRFRGSLLASVTAAVKFQLLCSDKLLVHVGYKFSCAISATGSSETEGGAVDKKKAKSFFTTPEAYPSVAAALKLFSTELPHCISLLQDLSTLEPLVDLRPDVVLLCLDFDYDELDTYHNVNASVVNATAGSQRQNKGIDGDIADYYVQEQQSGVVVSADHDSSTGATRMDLHPQRVASEGLFYFLYESSANRRAQQKSQHENVHNFDAVSTMSLLLELSSLVPVLEASFSTVFMDNDAFTAAALPTMSFEQRQLFDVKGMVAPISACRQQLLLSCLYLLKIFSPGSESTDLETFYKSQALESTFLALNDRLILGSLPLMDDLSKNTRGTGKSRGNTVLMKLFPNIFDVLNFSHKDTSMITSSQFYSPKRCSAVVTAIINVLSSYQFDAHWFARLDDIRHHIVTKCNALHHLVCNKLYCVELEQHRQMVSNSFALLTSSASGPAGGGGRSSSKRSSQSSYIDDSDTMSVASGVTIGTLDSAESEVASLLEQLSVAVRRRQGPSLRLEDRLGVRLVLGAPQLLDLHLSNVHKTVFFALRRRYANLYECAIISELIHEQGFGHGVYAKPHRPANTPTVERQYFDQFMDKSQSKRLNYCTRNRFWRSVSVRTLLNYLHVLTLYRADLKQKTDIRLIGSETSFNHLLADLTSIGINDPRAVETRRRLLDSYSAVTVDPIERFGFGAVGTLTSSKLAMHFSICSLISDDRSLFLTMYPHRRGQPGSGAGAGGASDETKGTDSSSGSDHDEQYRSHTNYEQVLEHGGQLARDTIKCLLRDGEWEICSDILHELISFYQTSSRECVDEARVLSETSATDLLRGTNNSSNNNNENNIPLEDMYKFGIDIGQLSEAARRQRHGYCLDHYRRNVALWEEMVRAREKTRERRLHDSETRPFPLYYAARVYPNPFVPSVNTHPNQPNNVELLQTLAPFLECTSLPCSLTVPMHHRHLVEEEHNFYELHDEDVNNFSGHNDEDSQVNPHKQYLDAELLLDPADSVGVDRATWILFRVDPTAHISASELYTAFAQSEKRAREKGEISNTDDQLPVFVPPSSYHALEAQLCTAFPEYRIVAPDTHMEIGSNLRSNSSHRVQLDRTIQLFEAFPQNLCENSSVANELLEKAEAADGQQDNDGDEWNAVSNDLSQKLHNRRLSTATKQRAAATDGDDDEYVAPDEDEDQHTRIRQLWEGAMQSTQFYIYAYENQDCPFSSLINHKQRVNETNIDPDRVRSEFEDEYGPRLLRYTLSASAFNVDKQEIVFDQAQHRQDEELVDEYGYNIVDDGESVSQGSPTRYGGQHKKGMYKPSGNGSASSSHSVYPAMHSLFCCSWLSPSLFARIESIRRMDCVSACSQVLNAQLTSAYRTRVAMESVNSLSPHELQALPAGDLAMGPAVLVAALNSLSNLCVQPTTCIVGMHSARLMVRLGALMIMLFRDLDFCVCACRLLLKQSAE
jgi:hypothetical protein